VQIFLFLTQITHFYYQKDSDQSSQTDV
jgi:hypothetical protein